MLCRSFTLFLLPLLLSCARSVSPNAQSSSGEAPQWQLTESIYQAMERGSGRLAISLEDQTLRLYDQAGRLALSSDCSTGIPGHETPAGRYRILEMIVEKRSNLYGKYVDKHTGETVVAKSWEVDGPPAGTKFQGTAMPYWMRLTWDGVGIHVGAFPRGYRSSFGCIRMPEAVQPLVYAKCRLGTRVTIH
ncbi:MAG: L,D-transpeptidase family protein [Verrucomicrobiota bacterium JB023]|nr:L,D-transpeptidase family protein [Verrucomicrobiota bacterium JB023]